MDSSTLKGISIYPVINYRPEILYDNTSYILCEYCAVVERGLYPQSCHTTPINESLAIALL